jgi:hypothetical protein
MSVYPTLLAGQRITADLLNSMLPIHAAKSADTSRASTTTITADPELQVPVEANADYIFHALIRYSGSTAGDMSVIFTSPSGSTGVWGGNLYETTATLATDPQIATRTPLNSQRDIGCISSSVSMILRISGRIRMGSTAGTFSFDWAQVTSNATATIVSTDSWLMLRRIG